MDLGTSQPLEWVMRGCLLGVQLTERLGLGEVEINCHMTVSCHHRHKMDYHFSTPILHWGLPNCLFPGKICGIAGNCPRTLRLAARAFCFNRRHSRR